MFEGLSTTTITFNFKVGGTVSPYLLVGFDGSAINFDYSAQFYSRKEGNPDGSQFINIYLGFDWY